MKKFYVYLLASNRNGTLYVGVTSDLVKRVYEHKNDLVEGFTKEHQVHNLVWYEMHDSAESSIAREKQIKRWKRPWKLKLVDDSNPFWHDLYDEISQQDSWIPDLRFAPSGMTISVMPVIPAKAVGREPESRNLPGSKQSYLRKQPPGKINYSIWPGLSRSSSRCPGKSFARKMRRH